MLYNSFMPEWIGKTIGKVRIDKELAKGGMAEVYLGMHVTLDRPVAIKVMHNYIESDPDLQSRFEREAKVVAALRHPNIVQIFDFDTAEGHPYIVADGFTHVRHLLFSFNATPKQIGFMRGLDADTTLLNESGQQMLASFETGDETDLDFQVERMLNVIVGSQIEDYKDWNVDGNIYDPGDGFGLLLNGENLGYIQGIFTHADLALTSSDATQNMLVHGEHVKICAVNMDEWTPQLRDQLIAILESSFDSPQLEAMIRNAVALADKIRNGIDINGNENVEPISGEGGAITAYEHAYYMADMVIFAHANGNSTP